METDLSDLEEALAAEFYEAAMHWSGNTERSQQDQNFIIGVSSIGHCSEKVRRMLMRETPTQEPDKLAAFIGTWVGAGIEQAILARRPDAIIQSEIEVELVTDEGTFVIGGHPDLILPDEGIVLDVKTTDGLAKISAYGTFEKDAQKRIQRHLYAKGAWEAGVFGDLPLEDVKVGNLWCDRSASDHKFLVRLEPFSHEVVAEAGAWLSEVAYAFKHKIEARKEPSREFCQNWCEFFSTCRSFDTDVEGLIEDPTVIGAIDLYREGSAMKKQGELLQKQASADLKGVAGSTGEWSVRWVEVDSAEVAYTRRGYSKLSLSKVK